MISPAVKSELDWDLVRRRLDLRIESGLAAHEADAESGKPKELHLELTHRCNLKCVMCEHWEMEYLDPGTVKREMDFEKIRRLTDSPLLEELESIAITGGEPWLRADFVDIVTFLTERFSKANVIVLSNFWNTAHVRSKLEEFRRRGVERLRLGSSLDGLEETHDRIRGQRGAFDGLVKTVSMLREAFPEVPYGFTYTITPENAGDLFETYRFVSRNLRSGLGAQWVVDRPGVKPMLWEPATKEKALDQVRKVLLDLCQRFDAARKAVSPSADGATGLWSELLYWRYLEEYGRRPRRFGFFKSCMAGSRHVMLDPEGELFFCPVNREKTIGNAVEEGLDRLWGSEKAETVRDFVASGQCDCWLRCTAAPVLDRLVRFSEAS